MKNPIITGTAKGAVEEQQRELYRPRILIVDPDAVSAAFTAEWLRAKEGYSAEIANTYAAALDALRYAPTWGRPDAYRCLILDTTFFEPPDCTERWHTGEQLLDEPVFERLRLPVVLRTKALCDFALSRLTGRVSAIVMKSLPCTDLANAIARSILCPIEAAARQMQAQSDLSARQTEILIAAASGLESKEIATMLGCSTAPSEPTGRASFVRQASGRAPPS